MARGFIAQFLVDVRSKGLGKSKADIESLGNTVDRVAEANARADKSSKNMYSTMEKGVIGTANGTKSFSKMAETIGGGGRISLVGVYATLAANVFAVTAAFNALRSAAQVEQVLRGLDAAGARVGLTLSVTTKNVQDLAQGMLTAEQAARSTAQFMAGGFKTEQLERMTVLARDISIALGRNMTDSMDRLTRGTLKLEPELLDELGIMTKLNDATALYAAQLNKPVGALTQFERRQGFMNSVLAEGELKFGGLAESAGDTTVYDRLSATFSNLTKDVFGFVNDGLGGLIGGIADSKVALIGMITLFVSTIKGQLLPVFNNLGRTAQLNAQILSRESVNVVAALGDQLEDTNHDASLWASSVQKGTATMDDYKIAIREVNKDISDHVVTLREAGRVGNETFINTRKSMQQELAALRDIRREMLTYERLQYKAKGNQLIGQGIELGSQGKFRTGLKDVMRGFDLLNGSIAPTAGTLTKLGNTFTKVGSLARFFGASLLYALPYIGLIIAAGGALYAWLTKLTPAQEKHNKALEDFGEITSKTGEKVRAYNEMQTKQATAATRAQSMMKLQSQAIMEVVDAYSKLNETIKEAQKEAAATKLTDRLTELYSERAFITAARIPGLDTSSVDKEIRQLETRQKIADKFKLSLDSPVFELFGDNISSINEGTIKLTDSLSQLDNKALKNILQRYGALDENQKAVTMSAKRWNVTLEATAKEMRDNAAAALEVSEAVTSAFKLLDDAVGQFILSATPSTPYDSMVKGFDAAVDAVKRLNIEFERGRVTAQNYYNLLSGLGQRTGTIMPVNTQADLAQFNSLDAREQHLKNQYLIADSEERQKNLMTEITNLERERNTIGSRLSRNLVDALVESQKITRELQAQSITLQNQVKYLQAQRSTYQSIYDLNSQGLKAQYEREDQIRNNQVQQLENQMHHHKRLIQTTRVQIQQLEAQKKLTFEYKLQEEIDRRRLTIDNLRNQFLQERQRIERGEDRSMAMARIQRQAELLGDINSIQAQAQKATILANREIDLSIQSLLNNISGSENSLKSLQAEVNTLMAQALTDIQKQAQYRKKDYEISQKYIEMLKEQATLLSESADIAFKLRNINDGITDNLLSQAKLIEKSNKEKRAQIVLDANNRLAGLAVQRDEIRANIARARAEKDVTGPGTLALQNLENQIAGEQRLTQIRIDNLDKATALQLLELAIFDVRKEGIEWQKEGLELQQKAIDNAKQLAEQQLKNTQYAEQTARIRSGAPVTEDLIQRQEIDTKIQAYKLALAELEIRESMIDLEYALLDAQRVQLQEELVARRELLLLNSNLDENSPRIRQLTQAIENLSRGGAVDILAANAKKVIREQAEGIRLELDRMSIIPNKFVSDFLAPIVALRDLQKLQISRRAANAASRITPGDFSGSAVVTDDNSIPLRKELLKIDESLQKPIEVMWEQNSNLKVIADNTTKLVEIAGGIPTATTTIQQAQAAAKAAGLTITEPVGVDSGGHKGKGHAQGRAFDASIAAGNADSTNSQNRATMDALADKFVKAGFVVLWNGLRRTAAGNTPIARGEHQHRDHMHVEISRGMEQSRPIQETASATNRSANALETLVNSPEKSFTVPDTINEPNFPEFKHSPLDIDVSGIIEDIDIAIPATYTFMERLEQVQVGTSKFIEQLKQLGPQGEAVAALTEGMIVISANLDMAFKEFKDGSLADKVIATASVISSTISMINAVTSAASNARIANIEQEIAAEQKRDGKSAESVAKIQALERKKDAIARKQFNVQKKLQIAQAVMSTAAAVAGQLAAPPPGPWNIALAAMMGALGAAQIAIIAGQSYQGGSTTNSNPSTTPQNLTIGKRGDSVDLARNNVNAGGEIGYLRGAKGYGRNASDYYTIGSAYGGPLPRGYGNTAFVVGEKGPEIMTPETPVTVRPIDNKESIDRPMQPVNFNINALDARGVEEILLNQRGNIIGMLREAANANGETFLEDVNTNVYTSPRVSRL